ncbi:MAG: tail fiber domain-containing protein, partial [Pseudomonadota bacterium]|nr:tail fiber domain-containing protein [Pseudomonadota bacterium]
GVEFGNKVTTATPTQFVGGTGTLFSTFDVKTRFFDQINLAYYPSDDLKLFIGHRYIGGTNAFAAGGEWAIPTGNSTVASFFVEGRVGEDDYRGVWGGMKFYFGQKDKSLIRRHREDDPINWNPDSLFSLVKALKSQTTIGVCTDPNEIFLNGECRGRVISDIRLKRDIVLLARLANGIGLYRYRYLWSDIVYVGVIAQEVLSIVPKAILIAADGYFRVDYVRLGLRLLTWDEWVAVNAEEVSRAA